MYIHMYMIIIHYICNKSGKLESLVHCDVEDQRLSEYVILNVSMWDR